jgi:hypothetical protein
MLPIAAPAASILADSLARYVQSLFLFLFAFHVSQSELRLGERLRESQEQAANASSEALRDNSRASGDQSSKKETDGVVVPFRLTESGKIDFDFHAYLPSLPWEELPCAERYAEPHRD